MDWRGCRFIKERLWCNTRLPSLSTEHDIILGTAAFVSALRSNLELDIATQARIFVSFVTPRYGDG